MFITFTPPLNTQIPRDAHKPHLVEVSISPDSEYNGGLFALRKALNLAINGEEKKPIPLKPGVKTQTGVSRAGRGNGLNDADHAQFTIGGFHTQSAVLDLA